MVSNRPSTPSAKSQTARSDSAANINSTNTSINLVPPPIPPNRETSQTRGGGTLNFLRRSKSGERQNEKARRSISGTRLLKKNHKDMLAEQERQRLAEQSAVPKVPPVLPGLYDDGERRVAPLPTFGGENARPGSHQPVVGARSSSRGGVGPGGLTVDRTNQQYKNQMAQNMPFDPYARSESMTHRGRYSYASSAISTLNSPRRVRRRKDPTPFNVLVIGAKNSGKTSFLQFLRQSLAHKKRHGMAPAEQQNHHNGDTPPQTSAGPLNPNATFTSQYLETEIDGERIGLTLWDSEGLEKNVVDLQLRELSSFLESKFEETFTEEQKVVRATGIQDTHIHCVFLILDPGRLDKTISNFALRNELDKQPMLNGHKAGAPRPKGGLDPSFDLQVIRSLQGKTAVIPVIGKADTITTAHMGFLKRMVWGSLKDARLDPLEAFGLDDTDFNSGKLDERDEDDEIASTAADHQGENEAEEEDSGSDYSGVDPVFGPSTVAQQRDQTTKARKVSARTERQISAAAAAAELAAETSGELPYLPMSIISPDQYEPGNLGRRFPWGFADPFNAEHCDYLKLKEMVFSEWRAELRVASRERWYEDWRTSRLNRGR